MQAWRVGCSARTPCAPRWARPPTRPSRRRSRGDTHAWERDSRPPQRPVRARRLGPGAPPRPARAGSARRPVALHLRRRARAALRDRGAPAAGPAGPPARARRAGDHPPPRRPRRPRRADALRRHPPARGADACSSCPTWAGPSAVTGRRATGRPWRLHVASSPRGCVTSWPRPSATACGPRAATPSFSAAASTRRSSPPWRPRAHRCRRSRRPSPSPSSTRRPGRGEWPTRPASRSRRSRSSGASRSTPPTPTCAPGGCRSRCRGSSSRAR